MALSVIHMQASHCVVVICTYSMMAACVVAHGLGPPQIKSSVRTLLMTFIKPEPCPQKMLPFIVRGLSRFSRSCSSWARVAAACSASSSGLHTSHRRRWASQTCEI